MARIVIGLVALAGVVLPTAVNASMASYGCFDRQDVFEILRLQRQGYEEAARQYLMSRVARRDCRLLYQDETLTVVGTSWWGGVVKVRSNRGDIALWIVRHVAR